MLKSLALDNFTAFSCAELVFGSDLNIIVGENGLGKTHLLKLPYALLTVGAEEAQKNHLKGPAKKTLERQVADKLLGVFRPESLGRLARRRRGRTRAEVRLTLQDGKEVEGFHLHFSSESRSEVRLDARPAGWSDKAPVFFPTRELLTLFPGLGAAYRSRYLEIEEEWIDTCDLLALPALRGPREQAIGTLLQPLEEAMEGKVVLDRNGRFYLNSSGRGIFEMTLVAEGHRKFAMLARLIANGSLLDQGYLFWDEPESNLNPVLERRMAEAIVGICRSGVQTFLATHSLFFLRELEILLAQTENRDVRHRWFALRRSPKDDEGVILDQGDSPDELQSIASLEADLEQGDRFLREV